MDKKDNKKSKLDQLRSLWSSLPEIIKLVGAILGIFLAFKTLFPAEVVGISSFDAGPEVIEPGEFSVLSWEVSGATNITIEPDIGLVEPTGTSNVFPNNTTSYKLTASNGDKEDVAFCTVTVDKNSPPSEENLISPEMNVRPPENGTLPENGTPPAKLTPPEESLETQEKDLPSISSFNANPDVIAKGESSNLTWSVSDATEVTIEPGIGTAGLNGNQQTFPNETTTYTLTATNKAGSVNATKVVFVEEPSMPTSSVISTPEQASPANGEVFDNNTEQATLEWKVVSGAANYTVEIDSYDSNTGLWLSESSGSRVVSGILGTKYSFEFLEEGTGQCRWRIWAVSPEGEESDKSGWWNFSYPLNLSTETGDTSSL